MREKSLSDEINEANERRGGYVSEAGATDSHNLSEEEEGGKEEEMMSAGQKEL